MPLTTSEFTQGAEALGENARKGSSPLTRPLAHYSHGRWQGDLLFLAGQGCRDPVTDQEVGLVLGPDGSLVGYDIVQQTWGVFHNVERVLKDFGLGKEHLRDITVFLVHMSDFGAMNQVWNEFFGGGPFPCRTTIGVRELPGRNFIEMKAVAGRSL